MCRHRDELSINDRPETWVTLLKSLVDLTVTEIIGIGFHKTLVCLVQSDSLMYVLRLELLLCDVVVELFPKIPSVKRSFDDPPPGV